MGTKWRGNTGSSESGAIWHSSNQPAWTPNSKSAENVAAVISSCSENVLVWRWRSVFECISVDVVCSITWHQFSVILSFGMFFLTFLWETVDPYQPRTSRSTLSIYLITWFCSSHTFLPHFYWRRSAGESACFIATSRAMVNGIRQSWYSALWCLPE